MGVVALSRAIAFFNPKAAGFLTNIFLQWDDLIAGASIHIFVQVMDDVLTALRGSQKEVRLFRELFGPLLYATYMTVIDFRGTIPRMVAATYAMAFEGADLADLEYVMFDDYEVALLQGEAFNYLDYIENYWPF